MTDNVTLPAINQIVSTEDVGGGVHVQRTKVTWGPDGTANDADSAAGKGMPTSDNSVAWTTVWGVVGVPFTSADQHSAAVSVTDVPTTGQKLVIDDLFVSVDTNMSVTFKEETTATVMMGPRYLSANLPYQFTPRGKFKLATANKRLQVITSVSGNITVEAGYHSEA